MREYRTRPCCGTTYDCHHRDDCPGWGIEARAAKPCDLTADGWCATHSTGDGPAYCAAPTLPPLAAVNTRLAARLARIARVEETP
jgi:hypothetical protein